MSVLQYTMSGAKSPLRLFKYNDRIYVDTPAVLHNSHIAWFDTSGPKWLEVPEYRDILTTPANMSLYPCLQMGNLRLKLNYKYNAADITRDAHVPGGWWMSTLHQRISSLPFKSTNAIQSMLEFCGRATCIEVSANEVATPFSILYSMGTVHHLHVPEDGNRWWLVPYNVPPVEVAKMPHNRSGITNHNPIDFFSGVDPMKIYKRLKLVLGNMVVQEDELPEVTKVGYRDLPDGILLVSKSLASSIRLLTRDGNWATLATGDKVAGALPNGDLVKGTVIVTSTPGYQIVLGHDTVKGKVEYNRYTSWHIQSRAEDRVSNGSATLSYQATQWWPKLAYTRAKALLHMGEPSITDLIEGRGSILDYAELFLYWHYEDGVSVPKLAKAGLDIIEKCSIKGHEAAIKAKLMDKIDRMFNPPVNGAWLVAIPNTLEKPTDHVIRREDEVVGIPRSVWEKLGKPTRVCVTRFPIKGASSIVRMDVIVSDGYCLTISPKLMKSIFSGDFDGDQLLIWTDEDYLSVASSVKDAYEACTVAQLELDVPKLELPSPTNPSEAYLMMESLDGGGMGRTTTLRDNLYNRGIEEDKLLSFFERAVQPAIARKEGALLVDPFDRLDEIAKECGIDVEAMYRGDEPDTRANPALAVLRKSGTLDQALAIANSGGHGPHYEIVRALSGIRCPLGVVERKVTNVSIPSSAELNALFPF